MTETPVTPPAREPRDTSIGLRLRIWTACLSGALLAAAGIVWVLGTQATPPSEETANLIGWLFGAAIIAALAGAGAALWLDHHLVGHLRGLVRGVETGRVSELRGLPASAGWGEVSDLTNALQFMLARQRLATRGHEDLDTLRQQAAALTEALERWQQHETWEAPEVAAGPLSSLATTLTHGLDRRAAIDEQNREAAHQVAAELEGSLPDARESAEQAERGFVEATAMLTTVRELQRLGGELQHALQAFADAPAASEDASDHAFREQARAALEELVAASNDSVNAIGRGLSHVQGIADQVQRLANRSTLIAIHAVLSEHREPGVDAPREDVSAELKQLAKDVRDATDQTQRLAAEVDAEVERAAARMRGVREHALAKLESSPGAAPRAAAGRGLDDALRLLERVREMVQDAARKGERLSASGERASRAAERLVRRIEDEARDAEALVVRLAPVSSALPPVPAEDLEAAEPADEDGGATSGLRIVDGRVGEVAEDRQGERGERP